MCTWLRGAGHSTHKEVGRKLRSWLFQLYVGFSDQTQICKLTRQVPLTHWVTLPVSLFICLFVLRRCLIMQLSWLITFWDLPLAHLSAWATIPNWAENKNSRQLNKSGTHCTNMRTHVCAPSTQIKRQAQVWQWQHTFNSSTRGARGKGRQIFEFEATL